ncbi:hypothetical protein ACH42_01370 [Endozoicomonas sp. (ex Bugula neritina AB1)]|nr:hypothetical protein ACH42_01370 [Endozoicomonas sp. (ex Bugula neritina AB1)]
MASISFDNGISSVSRISSDMVDKDFPKSKSSMKPSGENIPEEFRKVLEMNKTFAHRELQFATKVSGQNIVLTPEEHHMMTDMAISVLGKHIKAGPEIKVALAILQESKALQEELMMSRNVLLAG